MKNLNAVEVVEGKEGKKLGRIAKLEVIEIRDTELEGFKYEVNGEGYNSIVDIKVKFGKCNYKRISEKKNKKRNIEVKNIGNFVKLDGEIAEELEGKKMVVKGLGTFELVNGELVLLKRY